MMNKLTVISSIAATLLSALSCGSEQAPAQEAFTLYVSPVTVEAVALGEQKSVTVKSSTDWYARSSASWAKLPAPSGKASSTGATLNIVVDENTTSEERTAQITVSNLGKESASVIVKQAAGDGSSSTGSRGIATAQDLLDFAKAANGEGSISRFLVDGVVMFLKDIDASSITEWVPIGTRDNPLTYSIDGNNRKISNINWTIDVQKYPDAGFIGCARGVTIEKLTLGDTGDKMSFTGSPTAKVRIAGFISHGENVTLTKLVNNTAVEVKSTSATGANLSAGGLACYLDADSVIGGDLKAKGCTNNGNVTASVAGRLAGIVAYNSGAIRNCSNYGAINGPTQGEYGPGWLCSYNGNKSGVISNYGYGSVNGSPDMMFNSMINYEAGYDIENNTVDWTLDAYYDWKELEKRELHSGATYYHYSCVNVPRHVHVLEIDLKNPGIELTSGVANDIMPNPNGNKNNNNGFNKRERLSDLCTRKRSEGQKILAGTNACFFDSNDGISRGFHVEDCEPVYINNPEVVKSLTNHLWGFTVFTDGTASCGKKSFRGRIRISGVEYPYYSINDTTLRHASPTVAPVNLYSYRYVRQPYSAYPSILNNLAANVLYVICEFTSEPMKVNAGYAKASVVKIADGRSSSLSSLPYLTNKNQIGIAVSGSDTDKWPAGVMVGDIIEMKCDISIDGDTPGSSASLYTAWDPCTFPVVSQDRTKVWLVEVDGRQGWYSMGIRGYELYRIAKKLGGWWTTRLDGGGSSAMWVWNPSTSKGGLVNSVCDSKGERSCMTYLLLREK